MKYLFFIFSFLAVTTDASESAMNYYDALHQFEIQQATYGHDIPAIESRFHDIHQAILLKCNGKPLRFRAIVSLMSDGHVFEIFTDGDSVDVDNRNIIKCYETEIRRQTFPAHNRRRYYLYIGDNGHE